MDITTQGFLIHLGFRFIVVISLISCSSRKEKLGSNTPINFITSWRFSPETESGVASADSDTSTGSNSLNYRTRSERVKMLQVTSCEQSGANCYSEAYLYLLLLKFIMNQLKSMASLCHDLYCST